VNITDDAKVARKELDTLRLDRWHKKVEDLPSIGFKKYRAREFS
jgi:hypothetical protein